jgi:biotin transport system substrate-specific component
MEIVFNREISHGKAAARILGISVFVVLTALGGFVRIPLPFSPVPITLQTFFVLLGAAALGKSRGALVQTVYVLLGTVGLPIFSGAGSGLVYLTGPTAGYLLGFIAASLFIGKALDRDLSKLFVFLVFLAGDFLILGLGGFWLKAFLKVSCNQALAMGVIPFIFPDMIKAAIAAGVYQKIKARCKKIF